MTKKKDFLNNEIWVLTFGGGLQRANVYKKNSDEKKRRDFRGFIRNEIEGMVKKDYIKSSVSTESHIKNMISLRDKASKNFSDILTDDKLKLGVVQKIFNLYLKYLWSLGECVEPPHCPFDRIIIAKLKIKNPPNWTELNSEKDYRGLVKAAENQAGEKSLANWELEVFSRR